LNNQWSHAQENFISATHVGPIRALSAQVRGLYAWPKLNDAEIKEVLDLADELVTWLTAHQLKEQDFVRQALIEGLEAFRFRLQRVGWFGWGYTIRSLRDVIGAYMALERGTPDLSASPDAAAVLQKVRAGISSIFEKIKLAKDVTDVADFTLRAYGATTLMVQGPKFVAGLLGFSSGG
jgi:hypothetical protein